MGRKKKKQSKPWCWYCNREFDDEKILIQHQKAKHFKCHICHKKLYTGPGLSIHCMQVHKETIDKVPNSQPNRGNIEIEIYGMEGIPEADLKAHESRQVGDDDDEPGAKRAKSDSPAVHTPPPFAGPQMPPGFPGGAGQPGAVAGLVGLQAGAMPGLPAGMVAPHPALGLHPGLHPGLQPRPFMAGVPGMPWGVMQAGVPAGPVQYSGQPTGPGGAVTGQPRLLLPGQVAPPAASSPAPPPKPTFPAYSTAGGPSQDSKPQLIATTGSSSKIVHPPEDLSLEELRAQKSKYRVPGGGAGGGEAPQQQQQAGYSASTAPSPGLVSAAQLQMSMAQPQFSMAQPHVSMAMGMDPSASAQLAMLQHQQQQQQQQLRAAGLVPGVMGGVGVGAAPGLPGGVQLAGVPGMLNMAAGLPGMVTSQPQVPYHHHHHRPPPLPRPPPRQHY